MRDVREVLRLHREGCVPVREIARLTGVARSIVQDMLARFGRSGLEWPVPIEISDAELEARLYGLAGVKPGRRKLPEPDWAVVARELKRKHVTLQVLWEEYIAAHPDGYRYSRWCELFRRWEGRLGLVMRQSHAGGEKLFVDYAGDTVPVVVDRRTGEIRDAHLFVAVLGGSSLSFACATWTEQFADWAEAHNAAFAFFGGVPQLLVPDNAKVAVIKACHFDPMLNRSYTDMARHYGTAVLPARSRKPKDKAKVEACVRQSLKERDVLVGLGPAIGDPGPAIDLIPEFLIIDRDVERVEAVDDLLHQRAHLVIVEVGDIIPCNLAPVGIDDADVGIIPGMRDRDYSGMQSFKPGVADTHHRERFRHLGRNALFIVPVHRGTIAANHPCSRPEPIRPPRGSARAMGMRRH
jgi:transposase